MGDSNQLTPLNIFCKQLDPINWIPLILSLTSLLRITTLSLRHLTQMWSLDGKATKISKRNSFQAMKYIIFIKLSYGSGNFQSQK